MAALVRVDLGKHHDKILGGELIRGRQTRPCEKAIGLVRADPIEICLRKSSSAPRTRRRRPVVGERHPETLPQFIGLGIGEACSLPVADELVCDAGRCISPTKACTWSEGTIGSASPVNTSTSPSPCPVAPASRGETAVIETTPSRSVHARHAARSSRPCSSRWRRRSLHRPSAAVAAPPSRRRTACRHRQVGHHRLPKGLGAVRMIGDLTAAVHIEGEGGIPEPGQHLRPLPDVIILPHTSCTTSTPGRLPATASS